MKKKYTFSKIKKKKRSGTSFTRQRSSVANSSLCLSLLSDYRTVFLGGKIEEESLGGFFQAMEILLRYLHENLTNVIANMKDSLWCGTREHHLPLFFLTWKSFGPSHVQNKSFTRFLVTSCVDLSFGSISPLGLVFRSTYSIIPAPNGMCCHHPQHH